MFRTVFFQRREKFRDTESEQEALNSKRFPKKRKFNDGTDYNSLFIKKEKEESKPKKLKLSIAQAVSQELNQSASLNQIINPTLSPDPVAHCSTQLVAHTFDSFF